MFQIFQNKLLQQERKHQNKKLAIVSVFSAALAAFITLFLSPFSGKENRQKLANQASKIYTSTRKKSKEVAKNAKEVEEGLAEKFNELKNKIEEKINQKSEITLVKEEPKNSKK